MIVRLDFEDGAEAVADINDPGIFSRALHHIFSLGGKALQVHAAGFIGTVLAPHHTENTELSEAGVPAQDFSDALVFIGCEPVFRRNLRRDFDFSVDHFAICDPKISRF